MRHPPSPSFLALVRDQEDTLLRAARLLTGDWQDAEDLLRDTLAWALSAWESLGETGTARLRVRQRLVAGFLERGLAARAAEDGAEDEDWVEDDDAADADDPATVDERPATADPSAPTGWPASYNPPPAGPSRVEAGDGLPSVLVPPPRGIVSSLAALDPEDRAVVVSRYYLGLSAGEISEVLGIDAEQVTVKAVRTLAGLRWQR
jgi:DNA-directed RNA polymerase specialized sigma24 family protein